MIKYHNMPLYDRNEELQSILTNDIVKLGERKMLQRPLFGTTWSIGRFCNYDCSYCWPHARTNKPDYLDFEIYIKSVDEIKKQARENGFTDFHWGFSGGEPTAYKKMLDLVYHLNDGITPFQSIHMTTNLSPGKMWWKKWCENTATFQKRSISASYHAEFAIEEEFEEKCLQLIEANVGVNINQVMVPKLFWELYERCKRFYEKGININILPQRHKTNSSVVDGYTDEMLNLMQTDFPRINTNGKFFQMSLFDEDNNEYLLDHSERFNAYGFNKFRDWECAAGFQSIIISGNEVKRGYSCYDKPLGTLPNFKLFNTAKHCITPTCACSADSKIPKWKNTTS